MILNSLLNQFSRIMHGNPSAALPEEKKDPRTAEIFRKSAESLEVLRDESSLKVAGDSMTFCSPGIPTASLRP